MNKDLKAELCGKVAKEQEVFETYLLTLSPKEILNRAYEFSVKQDIVFAVEQMELKDNEIKVLLNVPDLLMEVYEDFINLEDDYMDNIRSCVIERAERWLIKLHSIGSKTETV